MICSAGLGAHLRQLFKLELRVRIWIVGDRNHHQKIADRRDAKVIPVRRMNGVAKRVRASLDRLSAKISSRKSETDNAHKRRFANRGVDRARGIDLAKWN